MTNKIEYLENGININGEFILLSDITEKCNSAKIEKDDLVLLKMEWEGRGGEVYEHVVYPKETALKVKELLLGKTVSFGEIWGKHSDVYGEICNDTFEIVEDKEKVKQFLNSYPKKYNCNHSFIETVIEYYEDNGGREWAIEEGYDEEYCSDIEELKRIQQ